MALVTFHQFPRPNGTNIAAMLMLSRTRLSRKKRRAPTVSALSTQTENHTPPAMPATASTISSQPANCERSSSAKNAEKGAVTVSNSGPTFWLAAAHMGCVPSIGSICSHSSSSSQLDRLTCWMTTWSSGSMAAGLKSLMKSAVPENSAPVKASRKHTAIIAAQLRRNWRFPRVFTSFLSHIVI